ncbi:MAG: hypothetical protein PHE08_06060, partial [Bacteroidales bacterium]|nr:hypothetical protein [Bacteroidales bacterium]
MIKLKYLAVLLLMLLSFGIYAQNDCATAVNIPFDVYATCGDMAFTDIDLEGASPSSGTPTPSCGNFGASTNDVWYSFVVPAGTTELAFHAFNAPTPMPAFPPLIPGSPAMSLSMAVYSGSCGNLDLLECFSESSGILQNGEVRWEVINGFVPGETIYVRLWDANNEVAPFFFAASIITELPEASCDDPPSLSSSGCNILAPSGTIQAPHDCGWTSTDNVVFYSFVVSPDDDQPVEIEIEYGQCWGNESGGLIPTDPEIQFAIYEWNGVNCNGIGGSPLSDPPNNTTYVTCENGTETVTFSQNLPPGQYVLAMDGFSYEGGNSLCTFGIGASFIEDQLLVNINITNAICGEGGTATINVVSDCEGNPSFNWSDGLGNTQSVENIPPGDYSVTVSDGPNCQDTVINFTIADEGDIDVDITTSGDECTGPFSATAN